MKEINTINFLVHPSFKTDSHSAGKIAISEAKYNWKDWLEEAVNMPDDEILVVVMHTEGGSQVKEALEREDFYIEQIRNLKKACGKRVIVINDLLDLNKKKGTCFVPEKMTGLIKMIKARGFSLAPEKLKARVYGEEIFCCVSEVAEGIVKSGLVNSPSEVSIDLTDFPIGGEAMLPKILPEVKKVFKNVRYK